MRQEIDSLEGQMRSNGPSLRFANPANLVEDLRILSLEEQDLDREINEWSDYATRTERLKARLLSYREKQLSQRS